MFFRVFLLVWFKVLPIILFVFFFLIGLLIFSIGVHEFARPLFKGKTMRRLFQTAGMSAEETSTSLNEAKEKERNEYANE
jgi:hypothetical protein